MVLTHRTAEGKLTMSPHRAGTSKKTTCWDVHRPAMLARPATSTRIRLPTPPAVTFISRLAPTPGAAAVTYHQDPCPLRQHQLHPRDRPAQEVPMRTRLKMLFLLLMGSASAVGAAGRRDGACDPSKLPVAIRDVLSADYKGWRITDEDSLTGTDPRTWVEAYPGECPGIASGHFIDDNVGYAISLIRPVRGSFRQQVVCFLPKGDAYDRTVLIKPARVPIVLIINRMPPGEFRSSDRTRTVTSKYDAVAVSQIEAWTLVFYWNGKEFRSILTSD